MKKLNEYILNCIDKNEVLDMTKYGFKDMIDVFVEVDVTITSILQKKNKGYNKKIDYKIYVDGAHSNSTDYGGIGIIVIDCNKNNEYVYSNQKYLDGETNNRAELLALKESLFYIKDNLKTFHTVVYSDSSYAINCITKWADTWIKNNWETRNKTEVKNKELIKEIYILYKELKDNNYSFDIQWIKGHDSNEHNKKADTLAKNAMYEQINDNKE